MANKGEKQYGLILSKKQQTVAPAISNVFGDDAGSDEEDGTDWVRKALKAEGEKNKVKKQTKLDMQKALNENPTIYLYDEVYDEMERTKNQSKTTKQEDKRPKYIQSLLKAAERRKREQEHRIERMVQKEREAEGDEFADKESFVTSAYRAKLEEFKKLEEEEARMDRLEAIGDVTKQQDLSGFYRHLYEQTVDTEKQTKNEDVQGKANSGRKFNSPESTSSEQQIHSQHKTSGEHNITTKIKKSRQYRQRMVDTDNSSDGETECTLKTQKHNKNSVSPKHKSKSEVDEDEQQLKRQKVEIAKEEDQDKKVNEDEKGLVESVPPSTLQNTEEQKEVTDNSSTDEKAQQDMKNAKEKLELARKERSRIWEKRTVGPIFEAALQRYYARKAMRLSAA